MPGLRVPTLLHVRYVFGYLATGFLVSVPISLGSKIGYGLTMGAALKSAALSVGYGAVLIVPFLALIPFTRFDWKSMRVPEFQLFEKAVARSATFAALGLFVLFAPLRNLSEAFEPGIVWTVFVLMLFYWGRIKVQTLVFPEFYA